MIIDTAATVLTAAAIDLTADVATDLATEAGGAVVVHVVRRGFFATGINGLANLIKANPVVSIAVITGAAAAGAYVGYRQYMAEKKVPVVEAVVETAPAV